MRKRLRHLPSGLLASAALLAVGVPLAAVLRGGPAAIGVVAGVLLVALSYVISSVVVAWVDRVDPRLILPVGLLTYVVKVAVIGLVMWRIQVTGWTGLPAMGVAIIATVLGWITAQAWWTWRARIPYVEIERG